MRSIPKRLGWLIIPLFALLFPARAEEPVSRLVIFISTESLGPREFSIKNSAGKVLYTSKWKSGLPLLRMLSIPEGEHKIGIPGPLSAVTVGTTEKQQTFLEFSPYATEGGDIGVGIRAWRGSDNADIQRALSRIKEAGDADAFKLVTLTRDQIGEGLVFGTDPDWPNPFEPKPKPPPPEK